MASIETLDRADQAERIRDIAAAWLDARRFEHSLGVAETAASLCRRYGLDADAGYLAGLAHDLCKRLPLGEQLALARLFAGPLPAAVFLDPKLPHGPAAAALLERDGLSTDPAVIEAVAYHTVGRVGMGPVALAVYVADKIEPGRGDWSEGLRLGLGSGRFSGDDGLERLASAAIEAMLDRIAATGRIVADTTIVLYNSLAGKSVRQWPVRS